VGCDAGTGWVEIENDLPGERLGEEEVVHCLRDEGAKDVREVGQELLYIFWDGRWIFLVLLMTIVHITVAENFATLFSSYCTGTDRSSAE
jgi:hypothetical protein